MGDMDELRSGALPRRAFALAGVTPEQLADEHERFLAERFLSRTAVVPDAAQLADAIVRHDDPRVHELWRGTFAAPAQPRPTDASTKANDPRSDDEWLRAAQSAWDVRAARAGRLQPDAAHEIGARMRDRFDALNWRVTVKDIAAAKLAEGGR